ncbi:MAG: hypothetical protein AB8G17_00580 [Gammaproteobacteria bacterium]
MNSHRFPILIQCFSFMLFALSMCPAQADTVPNGGSISGFLNAVDNSDSHTFDGVAGRIGLFSIGGDIPGGEFYSVFDPTGVLLTSGSGQRLVTLPMTGSYTVVIQSFQTDRTGNYRFHLAVAPGANEHGVVANGSSLPQSLDVEGDIDSFVFDGTAGQSGVVSISGDVSGGEFFTIVNPDGTSLTSGSSQRNVTLPQSGIYTVLVQSFQSSRIGDYRFHLALALGANEHGVVPNGSSVTQVLDVGGDIDSFTFDGIAGQAGLTSISGDVSGGEFYTVFNPDATTLTSGSAQRLITLPQTGTYTVVVQSFQTSRIGSYRFHLALAPTASEHGVVQNGGSVIEELDVDGDIDSYTFDAQAGQGGVVSISGGVSGGQFYYLFAPDSSLVTSGSAQRVIALEQTGTYTVVVSSFQTSGTGPYEWHLALAPGANEHGLIPSNASATQNLDDDGEIDSFTLNGFAGADGVLTLTSLSGTGKFMRVFGPDGSNLGNSSSQVSLVDMAPGIHTVVVRSFQTSGTGDYLLDWSVDCASSGDSDGDGVPDACDNCTVVANALQEDSDNDGFGNQCDADFNQDCVVNVQDLGFLRSVFFTNDPDADLNSDGVVNIIDLGVLRTLFFMPPGPSATGQCSRAGPVR